MLAYILLAGIVVSGLAFAAWLAAFVLNRTANTSLETASEGRRSAAGQLAYGGFFLGLVILLGVIYFQLDHEPVLPPMPAQVPATATTPTGPPPAAMEAGLQASIVFVGIFVSGLAFVIWFVMYSLNRSINTSLVTGAEDRRIASRQLAVGAFFLSATVVLTVVFFQMDRSAIVPDLDKPQVVAPAAASTAPASGEPVAPAVEAPAEESPDGAATEPAEPASETPAQPVAV